MTEADLFRTLEIDSKELEAIANQYDENSPQHIAIKRAAWALTYVVMYQGKEFLDFLINASGGLSAPERRHLRELGLDDNEPKY